MTALYFALPGRARPGQRQAARLAGLPRHPVPAGQPGPRPTCRRCAPSAACSPTRAGPRTRTGSTSRTGVGRPRRGGAAVRRGRPALRGRALRRPAAQPVHRADRRRRAGRGQHLGGGRRPGHRRAWATCCGSSTSTGSRWTGWCPASGSRSGSSSSPRRAGTWSRPSTGGGCRPRSAGRAGRRCGTGSTRCPTSSTSRCSAWTRPRCGPGSATARRPTVTAVLRGPARRRAGRAGHRPGRPRPGHAAGGVRRVRRGPGPAERAVRLHDQGLGPAHRGQPAQPLGAADRPSRSTRCATRLGPDRGHRVGPAGPDDAGRAVGRRPPRAPGPAR